MLTFTYTFCDIFSQSRLFIDIENVPNKTWLHDSPIVFAPFETILGTYFHNQHHFMDGPFFDTDFFGS